MELTQIKTYMEIAGSCIFFIAVLIFLIKMLKTKMDKNGNGKIEKEEISDADMQFLKEMLKESIQTIATGMQNLNGITGQNAYKILLSEVKASKKIFEESQKKENRENEKNS